MSEVKNFRERDTEIKLNKNHFFFIERRMN